MDSPVTVLFQPMNRMVAVPAGSTVLDAIREAGITFESICGGKGLCGKCRVIHRSGEISHEESSSTKQPSREEKKRGYCLACSTKVWSDAEFTIPVESRIDNPRILLELNLNIENPSPAVRKYAVEKRSYGFSDTLGPSIKFAGYSGRRPEMSPEIMEKISSLAIPFTATISKTPGNPRVIALEEGDTSHPLYGIAIDLGTTTVAGVVCDLVTGVVLKKESTLNRQITLGEELVTRIAVGRRTEGRRDLQTAAITSINEVIERLCSSMGISGTEIVDLSIGGNTVMIWLLAGYDPSPLGFVDSPISHDPLVMEAKQAGISINPDGYIYCLPAVSRFVGGDAIGDILVSGMHTSPDISLLVDLGTNGELILGNNEWLVSTSCASGPAFEGAGMRSGIRAMKGAVDRVSIDPDGSVHCHVIGDSQPKGICGSGIIEAAAAMASVGILDFSGRLVNTAFGVREGEQGPEYVLVPAEKTATGQDIVITKDDMAYLMDSKAAVLGAINVLLKKYRIDPGDIRHVYLAGAFGSFGTIDSLVSFGILPDFRNAEIHRVGNGSLAGAYTCLLSEEARKDARLIAGRMGYIDLLVDNDFVEEYWNALRLPDLKKP
ncbi:MAG: ASKHA domain-containing protein [Methanospirillum sp.]|nr:ASKHA domain-containing protein [Methanospirillum sp.]